MNASDKRRLLALVTLAYFVPFLAEELVLVASGGLVPGAEFLLPGVVVGAPLLGGLSAVPTGSIQRG